MDVALEFYPISISRKVSDGNTKMYIFGRDRTEKQYCLIDTYEPYFYILPHDEINNINKSIRSMEINGVTPKRTEIIKIKFGNKEREVIKIIVNVPREISILKNQIDILDIGTCFDFDVSVTRKYIFDRKITFLVSHNVVGELIESAPEMKCPIIMLKSIEEIGTDIYKPDILALNIETYNPLGKQKIPIKDPIVMISIVSKQYRKVITWKHFKTEHKDIEIVSSEEELITRTREIIDSQKPDIIVGYHSDTFDLPYLKLRATKYRINFDVGTDYSPIEVTESVSYISGICHIDLFKFSKNFLKVKSSNLDNLIHELVLDNTKVKTFSDLVFMWNHADIENLCEHYLIDTEYILTILQKNLSFLITTTKFISLPIYDISRMNQRQLVEWFLIKNAKDLGVIVPNKPSPSVVSERLIQRKIANPTVPAKPGLYSRVISFNFESLYPAIIAAHNISSEALKCNDCNVEKITIDFEDVWFCKNNKGFIPAVLEDLLSRIFRIIDIIKTVDDEKQKKILENRLAISKIIANGFYLNFSQSQSRWYNKKLYESALFFGSKYISLISDIIKSKGFEVIYCDSKRMFVLMDDKSENEVKRLVDFINISLPGIMEMQIESFFERVLFFDNNNRIMLSENKLNIMGFDYSGKDFCFYAKNAQHNVFKMILQNNSIIQAHNYVKKLIENLRNHKVPVHDLIIYRVLSRNLEDYTEKFPHVEVAKEMRAKNYVIDQGSVIKYVIVLGMGALHERAKIPSEVKRENIDSRFYIEHQLLPCIEEVFKIFNISREELLLSKGQADLETFKK